MRISSEPTYLASADFISSSDRKPTTALVKSRDTSLKLIRRESTQHETNFAVVCATQLKILWIVILVLTEGEEREKWKNPLIEAVVGVSLKVLDLHNISKKKDI